MLRFSTRKPGCIRLSLTQLYRSETQHCATGQSCRNGLQPHCLDDISVKVRKNRASRQAETALRPLPLRAQLEQFLAIFFQRATRPRHEKLLVRICVLIPRPGVPKVNATIPKCRGLMFPDGDIAGPTPSRASDRLASSTFALYFEYSTQTKWCCSGNRHPIFRSDLLFRLLWTTYHILAQEQCMTTENNTPEYIFYRPLYSGAHGVSA